MSYYLTQRIATTGVQLNMLAEENQHVTFNDDRTFTRTIYTSGKSLMPYEKAHTLNQLRAFNRRYNAMMKLERSQLYRHYSIPKRSGGFRPIDDPCDELRVALTELKDILSQYIIPYHACAAAYIEGRSTITAVKRLMSIRPNNILHLDLHSFFPSTTLDFVINQMKKVYPFAVWMPDEIFTNELRKALSLAFLNNGLPQGTNISPFISNLMMVGFDHEMNRYARANDCVYTRYADDIYFSCYSEIDVNEIKRNVRNWISTNNASFTLNEEKTKLLRVGGPVYILGISIGADKKMSVGSDNKRFMKAAINNFCAAIKNGVEYNKEEAMELQGLLSYYKCIEEQYFCDLVRKYEQKYRISFKDSIAAIIRG